MAVCPILLLYNGDKKVICSVFCLIRLVNVECRIMIGLASVGGFFYSDRLLWYLYLGFICNLRKNYNKKGCETSGGLTSFFIDQW